MKLNVGLHSFFIDLNFFKTFECLLTCIHYNNHNPKKEKKLIFMGDYCFRL